MFITWSNNKEEKIVWKENSWFFSTVLFSSSSLSSRSVLSYIQVYNSSLTCPRSMRSFFRVEKWTAREEQRAQQHAITARLKLIYTTSLPTNQRLMLSHSLHVIISVPMFAHLLWVRAVWERPSRVQWCFQCACCIMCFLFFGWLMSDPLELIQRRWSVAVQAKQHRMTRQMSGAERSEQTNPTGNGTFIHSFWFTDHFNAIEIKTRMIVANERARAHPSPPRKAIENWRNYVFVDGRHRWVEIKLFN